MDDERLLLELTRVVDPLPLVAAVALVDCFGSVFFSICGSAGIFAATVLMSVFFAAAFSVSAGACLLSVCDALAVVSFFCGAASVFFDVSLAA